ncbi:MAG: choice-of-anchor Q domain-containing protein, partial [Elusimicrobiales bacterium]
MGNIVFNIGIKNCGEHLDWVHGIYHSNLRGHILNNIVYHNSGYGFSLWHAPSYVTISNNLAFGNGRGGIYVGADKPNTGVVAQGFVVTNNIIVDNDQYGIIEMHDLGANFYSNNIVYGHTNLNIALKNGNTAQNTLIVAPSTVFVNYQVNGSGDYHLKAASPAIDKGTSQGAPADDYDGVARPRGSAFDIGAYEYVPSAAIDASSPTAPGGLYASGISSSAFTLGWTASTDNVGVAGYRLDVSLNSGFSSFVAGYNNLDLGGVSSKTVSGLAANTPYYARLRAYDAAGNISPVGAALSVRTAQVFTGSVNYYVATTGSDSYTAAQAQNPATPWKTIQKAVSSVSAGATVHVAPGTYSYSGASSMDAAIHGGASGTASARIRYVSDTKWGAKIISSGTPAVWYNYGSYVDIQGFDISGDGVGGIYSSGSFVRIIGNHVHDIAGPPDCATGSNGGAGIDNTNYSASDSDIIGNVVHDIGIVNCGEKSPHEHGIYHSNLRGHIYNNIVYHNSAYGIHTWHAPKDLVISNNLTFGNGASGIIVGAGDAPGGGFTADGFVVANNISMNNGGYGILEEGLTGTNNIYKNNLIYGNSAGGISLQNGNTHQNTVSADPKFVNFKADGSGDYHLSAASPAIDKGTNQGAPADDYDGVARPQGAAFEIGAYEYVPSAAIDASSPTAPGGLYASGISSSAFTLGWTASTDNVGVAGYRLDVSLNSGFSSFVAGHNNLNLGKVGAKVIFGLAANIRYYARLRAYDSAGNISPNSVALSTATRAGPSSSPGTIEFSTGAYAVREQDGGAVITATRSGGS